MDKSLWYLTEVDIYLFGEGTNYEIYNKMGAHVCQKNNEKGVYFAVWAPCAKKVSVVGDFNDWNECNSNMRRISDGGVYELFVEGAKEGQLYKFLIEAQDGRKIYKADPYANFAQLRPETASIITDLDGFVWSDKLWIKKKQKENLLEAPVSIYEVHIGSWKRKQDGEFYNYREMAELLAEYVLYMGYTHVELIGIAEHPYDASWGYQVTNYYAPTSRYGTPHDFMFFVNYMHKKGIGVILDWVPAHFPKDAHGLAEFDGSCVYEYADPRKGEHPDWGTKVFDYGKKEVSNFLIANGLFWLDKFHIDGLRVDAVASMLYLDYGRKQGEWIPNKYGENGNLEAMEFLKHFNSIVRKKFPYSMTIAEESTSWPHISGDPDKEGCMGFTFKWNMGWMHDVLQYMECDPYFRKYNHQKLTFSMMYAYSEYFMLVLSHDEVVHLKKSMLMKMPGSKEDQFKNLKLLYAFMIGHPGKKLLFMGQDFGQLREWSEDGPLDWFLLDDAEHKDMQNFTRKCQFFYKKYSALYKMDYKTEGFQWINANDCDNSVCSFIRFGPDGKNNLVFVLNFTPVERRSYKVGVPQQGRYSYVFGTKEEKARSYMVAKRAKCDGFDQYILIDLEGFGIAVYKFQ